MGCPLTLELNSIPSTLSPPSTSILSRSSPKWGTPNYQVGFSLIILIVYFNLNLFLCFRPLRRPFAEDTNRKLQILLPAWVQLFLKRFFKFGVNSTFQMINCFLSWTNFVLRVFCTMFRTLRWMDLQVHINFTISRFTFNFNLILFRMFYPDWFQVFFKWINSGLRMFNTALKFLLELTNSRY